MTLQVTETQFADNILDRGLAFLTYIQTVVLTANKFQSTFVFNCVNYPVVLADIGYDGSCDYVLASYLNCDYVSNTSSIQHTRHYISNIRC